MASAPVATFERLGCTEPRIGTPASGDDRRVKEILQFSADIGVTLLPWQKELFDRALRMTGDRWTHRTILAITARQSGKSKSSSVRALAELCLWDARLVVTAAQSRDVALMSWRASCELAEESGMDIKRIRRAAGSEELILDLGGHTGSLKVVSSTSEGARGLSPQLVILDEVASLRTHEPYAALEKGRRAQPNSQVWAITTEGTHESVVLNGLQEQGRAAAAAGSASGIGYYEWSADPTLAPDDRDAWAQANPALGYLIDEETIAAEYRTDPPEVFARETLCWRTKVDRSWLRAGVWEATADRQATVPDSAVGEVTFAVDCAPDLSHASIDVAWLRPDGRLHVEAVAAYQGAGASASAEQRLHELVTRWQPRSLAVHAKGAAEALAGRVAAATETPLVTVSAADVDRAARSFYEATATGRLVHPPDPVLAAHLEAAQQGEPGTFVLRRRNPAAPIDAAVAAVLACWAADRTPVVTAPSWVAF